MNQKIELGSEVECLITGFAGTATGRCEYLTGCIRVLVTPRIGADNKLPEDEWIDESVLKVTKPATGGTTQDPEAPGGPMPNEPPRM